jgi:transcriptional regulator with XRE-family HTH domain
MKARALFAWNLRRLRLERGISQERLAADAEVDRAYVSELERKQGNATLDLMDKLAPILGVEMEEFFRVPKSDERSAAKLPTGRPRKNEAKPKKATTFK